MHAFPTGVVATRRHFWKTPEAQEVLDCGRVLAFGASQSFFPAHDPQPRPSLEVCLPTSGGGATWVSSWNTLRAHAIPGLGDAIASLAQARTYNTSTIAHLWTRGQHPKPTPNALPQAYTLRLVAARHHQWISLLDVEPAAPAHAPQQTHLARLHDLDASLSTLAGMDATACARLSQMLAILLLTPTGPASAHDIMRLHAGLPAAITELLRILRADEDEQSLAKHLPFSPPPASSIRAAFQRLAR